MKKKPRKELLFNREKLRADLKQNTINSSVIRIFTLGTSAVLTITSSILLARLLNPEDFGVFAMVAVVMQFGRAVMEMGLGTATVQNEEIDHNQVSTLFWFNVTIGVALMLIMMALSPVFNWFYKEDRLFSICMIISTYFLFGGLIAQHRSLLERQMKFGTLGIINIGATLLSIIIAIFLAYNNFSYWSLVWRELSFIIIYMAGVWLFCPWVPGLPKFNSKIYALIRVGFNISGYNIIQYFSQSVDQIIIGRYKNAVSLGLYSKALQLSMMPVEYIRMTFWGIGLSALSALQKDSHRYKQYFDKLLFIQTFFCMPLMIFLALNSEKFVILVFGNNWIDAAPFFKLFAIAGFIKPIIATFQIILISLDMTKKYLLWGLFNSIIMITSFAIGINWGTIGVAYGYIFSTYIMLFFSFYFCLKGTFLKPVFVISTFILPLFCSLSSALIMTTIISYIDYEETIGYLAISGLILFISYITIFFCFPKGRLLFSEMLSLRKDFLKRA